MKNGSLEFLIQNSRSPHKYWLYGPCNYDWAIVLERETGFEPATFSLGS